LLAHSFCSFPFAKEITLFHFVYSSCTPSMLLLIFLFFQFPYFFLSSITASATSSFHCHVSLCLHGPFDNPHVTCAVSIIIFFDLLPVFIYIKVRHLLDFLEQNKDNTGRCINNPNRLPPILTNWCLHLCHPHHFLRWMPFLAQLSQFILAWDRHEICWLAYPVA